MSEPLNLETIRALRFEIERVTKLLSEVEPKVGEIKRGLLEAETTLRRYISLADRLGFPADISQAIRRTLQMITVIRGLYTTLMLLTAATTPLGIVSALGGVAVMGFVATDIAMLEIGSH